MLQQLIGVAVVGVLIGVIGSCFCLLFSDRYVRLLGIWCTLFTILFIYLGAYHG